MTQKVNALTTNPQDQSLIPRIQVVELEKITLVCCALTPHTGYACVHAHTNEQGWKNTYIF